MTTEKELGEALKRGDSTIVVEFELANKVIRIKATEKGVWALCVGAIGVAAVCGVVTISTAGTATVPSAFIATPAIATASGVLGMSTTISAIGIAIAGGGVGALNKLRGYPKFWNVRCQILTFHLFFIGHKCTSFTVLYN